jgi:hypothetical protein
VALQRFVNDDHSEEMGSKEQIAHTILEGVKDITTFKGEYLELTGFPGIRLKFENASVAKEVYQLLLSEKPKVALDPTDIRQGVLLINTMNIRFSKVEQVVQRLRSLSLNLKQSV